jgi:hypothetical protein
MSQFDYPSNIDNDVISIGQAVVYGQYFQTPSAEGVTPSTPIGAIKDCSIEVTTTFVERKQGWPLMKDKKFPLEQAAQLKIVGEEHTRDKYFFAIGVGATDGTYGYGYGGNHVVKEFQFVIQKTLTSGNAEYWDCWRCTPSGTFVRKFEQEGQALIEYTFDLMRSGLNWINGAITDQMLFHKREIAAI